MNIKSKLYNVRGLLWLVLTGASLVVVLLTSREKALMYALVGAWSVFNFLVYRAKTKGEKP